MPSLQALGTRQQTVRLLLLCGLRLWLPDDGLGGWPRVRRSDQRSDPRLLAGCVVHAGGTRPTTIGVDVSEHVSVSPHDLVTKAERRERAGFLPHCDRRSVRTCQSDELRTCSQECLVSSGCVAKDFGVGREEEGKSASEVAADVEGLGPCQSSTYGSRTGDND